MYSNNIIYVYACMVLCLYIGKVELTDGRSDELFTSGYLYLQPSESDGMLHVCNRGEDWGLNEAAVVCRQLGYRKPYNMDVFNLTDNILHFKVDSESNFKWIENIHCAGTEQALLDCEYNLAANEKKLNSNITCEHVFVQCSKGKLFIYLPAYLPAHQS